MLRPFIIIIIIIITKISIVKRSICNSITYTLSFTEDDLHVTNTRDFPPRSPHSQPIRPHTPPSYRSWQSVNITEHRFSPITVYINSLQRTDEWQQ